MADLHGFNAHDVDPSNPFDPLPANEYLCIITASGFKPTKSGEGSYLELELDVLNGPYQGRKLWDRLNLDNSNETTVKIARAALSAICRATGVMQPNDSCELHDIPIVVKVSLSKRKDTDELQNVVKAYRKRDGAAPAGAASRPPSAPASPSAPAPQSLGKPAMAPWKRTVPPPAPAVADDEVPF